MMNKIFKLLQIVTRTSLVALQNKGLFLLPTNQCVHIVRKKQPCDLPNPIYFQLSMFLYFLFLFLFFFSLCFNLQLAIKPSHPWPSLSSQHFTNLSFSPRGILKFSSTWWFLFKAQQKPLLEESRRTSWYFFSKRTNKNIVNFTPHELNHWNPCIDCSPDRLLLRWGWKNGAKLRNFSSLKTTSWQRPEIVKRVLSLQWYQALSGAHYPVIGSWPYSICYLSKIVGKDEVEHRRMIYFELRNSCAKLVNTSDLSHNSIRPSMLENR